MNLLLSWHDVNTISRSKRSIKQILKVTHLCFRRGPLRLTVTPHILLVILLALPL